MSLKNKFQNWFYLDDEEAEVETPQNRQREEHTSCEGTTEKSEFTKTDFR